MDFPFFIYSALGKKYIHCQKGIVISNTALYALQSDKLHIKEVPAEKAGILKRESYLNRTFLHHLSADSQDRLLPHHFSDHSASNCLCHSDLAAADDLMEGTGQLHTYENLPSICL